VFVYNADSVVTFTQTSLEYPDSSLTIFADGVLGQRVRIQLNTTNYLSLAEVQVYEYVAVTGVSVVPVSDTLEIGDTLELITTISPTYASIQEVSYSCSDTLVATVSSSGILTAVGEGTATVTITTSEGDFTEMCSIIVMSESLSTISIPLKDVALFPNPAHEYFTLSNLPSGATITLINSIGSVVASYVSYGDQLIISTSGIGSGSYLIRIKMDINERIMKLIIDAD
jgi:hypothetical protein